MKAWIVVAALFASPLAFAQGRPVGTPAQKQPTTQPPSGGAQAAPAPGQQGTGEPVAGAPGGEAAAMQEASIPPTEFRGTPAPEGAELAQSRPVKLPITGRIVSVDARCNVVTVTSQGQNKQLDVMKDSTIIVDGQRATGLANLREGQYVRASFNDVGVLNELVVLSKPSAQAGGNGLAPAAPAPAAKPGAGTKTR